MQVPIELTDEQVDDILVKGLQSGFKINLSFRDEPNFYEINQAFRTLLAYYMGDKEFNKYIRPFNKSITSKKLAEAYNGL